MNALQKREVSFGKEWALCILKNRRRGHVEKKWNKFLVAKGEIKGKVGLPVISYREQAKWRCGLQSVNSLKGNRVSSR